MANAITIRLPTNLLAAREGLAISASRLGNVADCPIQILMVEGSFKLVPAGQEGRTKVERLRPGGSENSIEFGDPEDWRTNSKSALAGYIYKVCDHPNYQACGCFTGELKCMPFYDILAAGGHNYLFNTPNCSCCHQRMFLVRTNAIAHLFAEKARKDTSLDLRNRPDIVCLTETCPVVTRQYICRQKNEANGTWDEVAGSFRAYQFGHNNIDMPYVTQDPNVVLGHFLRRKAAAVALRAQQARQPQQVAVPQYRTPQKKLSNPSLRPGYTSSTETLRGPSAAGSSRT